MVTTIQLRDETLLLLKKLRDLSNASSYDEALLPVVKKELAPKTSGYGLIKGKMTRKELLAMVREEHVE